MTLPLSVRRLISFRAVSYLVLTGSSVFSVAARIPVNLNDNVVTCGVNARCSNKQMFGRNYKVIETAKFTVMVSISNEAAYTRADVSVANHADYSQNLSPEDFRVEVISPKAKVLLYVPPAELVNLPVAPVLATRTMPDTKVEISARRGNELEGATGAAVLTTPAAPTIDELYDAAKKEAILKEAAEREAAQKHLIAAAIPANEVVRGRVYFQKDPKAKQVNIVLPVAGLVFEFPYAMKF